MRTLLHSLSPCRSCRLACCRRLADDAVMVQVRDAAETDMPAVVAILNDAILHTTAVWSLTPTTLEARTSWWRERASAGYPVLVADDGGAVRGFASYGQFRPWEGYLHTVEHSIYVDAGSRGRRIGATLLEALLERAASQGKHVLIGGIEAENTASLRLHASLGFVETGRLLQVGRKFDRWLDLVFMQKSLGPSAGGIPPA